MMKMREKKQTKRVNEELGDKVTTYILDRFIGAEALVVGEKTLSTIPITDMRQLTALGRGVVCLYNPFDGCIDTYFSASSWKLGNDAGFEENGDNVFTPGLEGTGLGVLQGISRVPRVSTRKDALDYVSRVLEPANGQAGFYSRPRRIKAE